MNKNHIPLFEEFCNIQKINEISAYRANTAAAAYVHKHRTDDGGLAAIKKNLERDYPNINDKAFNSSRDIKTENGYVRVTPANLNRAKLIFSDDESDIGSLEVSEYEGNLGGITVQTRPYFEDTFFMEPRAALSIIGDDDSEIVAALSNIFGFDIPAGSVVDQLKAAVNRSR